MSTSYFHFLPLSVYWCSACLSLFHPLVPHTLWNVNVLSAWSHLFSFFSTVFMLEDLYFFLSFSLSLSLCYTKRVQTAPPRTEKKKTKEAALAACVLLISPPPLSSPSLIVFYLHERL